MKPRILTIGSSAIVTTIRCSSPFPEIGETALGDGYSVRPGGRGTNTAIAISKLGGDSLFCTAVGRDRYAAQIVETCSGFGVDTRFIKQKNNVRSGCITTIKASRENVRKVVVSAANNLLDGDDIENAFTSIPDAVLIQCGIPTAMMSVACEFAHRRNIPILLDLENITEDFKIESVGNIDILLADDVSAATLSGHSPLGEQSCIRATIALEKRVSTAYTVLRLGQKRGLFISNNKYHEMVAPFETLTVDTTAAFEALSAALTVDYIKSLHIGKPDIGHACTYAELAQAWTVSTRGALTSLPTEQNLKDFVEKNGISFKFYDN